MQENLSPEQLDEKYKALLDPTFAHVEPERFIPTPRYSSLGWIGSLLSLFLLAVLAPQLIFTFEAMKEEFDLASLLSAVGILVALSAAILFCLRLVMRDVAKMRELKQGRFRQGLYLTGADLLINKGKSCSLYPRDSLVEFSLYHVKNENYRVRFEYKDDSGEARLGVLPKFDLYEFGENREDAVSKLNHWIKNGNLQDYTPDKPVKKPLELPDDL